MADLEKILIDTWTYGVEDCLDYKMSAGCRTLREDLIDRASHGEIPEEAAGTWWGEVTLIRETCSFEVTLYYSKEDPCKHCADAAQYPDNCDGCRFYEPIKKAHEEIQRRALAEDA